MNAEHAVEHLVKATNKNFVFKSLLELGQLVCSCGISNVFKPVRQGKELQDWILKNPEFVERFYRELYKWCFININYKKETDIKLITIWKDILHYISNYRVDYTPSTIVFRYKKGYNSKYKSNIELPIEIGIQEYRKYIDWKFNKYQDNPEVILDDTRIQESL